MKMIANQPTFWQTLSALGLAGGLMSTSTLLHAEAEPAAKRGSFMEEIVVTARKREESLQNVPVSVTAFSEQDIEAKSLNSLLELAQFTPNLTMASDSSGGSGTNLSIRGIGSQRGLGGPGVGVYLDGVYVGSRNGFNLNLVDVAQVEVLRGPQGTLFGRNTIGGAVNMTSKRPGDQLEGAVEVTVGRYDRRDAKLNFSVPLIKDKLNAKISLASQNKDGYGKVRDFATNDVVEEKGDTDSVSGQFMLDWQATDNLNILLSVDAMDENDNGNARTLAAWSPFAADSTFPGGLSGLGLANIAPSPPFPPGIGLIARGVPTAVGPDFYSTYGSPGDFNELETFNTALIVDWELGETFLGTDTALKSISSCRDLSTEFFIDNDFGPADVAMVNNASEFDQYSQEFQLSGLSLDKNLVWVAGVYYYSENEDNVNSSDILSAFIPQIVPRTNLDFFERESWSVFGQATYNVTEKLSFTAGLRYTEDEINTKERSFVTPTGMTIPNTEITIASDDEEVTGRLGIEYAWTKDLMTYASVAKGYKTGGVINGATSTGPFSTPVPTTYLPEVVWTYELGLRSSWLDNRLRFNLTGFYTDYTDIQYVFTFVSTNGPTAYVSNGPEAVSKGVEMELLYSPIDNLMLSLGYGYIDSEYKEADPNGGPLTTESKFINAPENTYSISADYRLPMEFGELTAHVDYAWKDTIYFDIQDTDSEFLQQEDYGLLNARLSLALESGLTLSLFGTNLEDKEYITSAFSSAILGISSVTTPAIGREWGFSAKYEF